MRRRGIDIPDAFRAVNVPLSCVWADGDVAVYATDGDWTTRQMDAASSFEQPMLGAAVVGVCSARQSVNIRI